jgi:cytochrome c-type biogenesis protein CcmH/NrfG
MSAFAMGPAEIIVILVVSVVVAAAVAVLLALVFAWGRKSTKPPETEVKTADTRLRELGELHESGLITEDEYRKLRAAILENV